MTVPTLTPRAAREQSTFRALLDSMARPGTIDRLDSASGVAPLVAVAEALIDHEVTFAVLPENAGLTDTLLRQTGSHLAPIDVAAYVFCEVETLAEALRLASEGTPEYPDAGATIVCQVSSISDAGAGAVALSGPGIRSTTRVVIEGFDDEARRVFGERNEAPPLGIDVVFVATDGAVVSLGRYTQLEEKA